MIAPALRSRARPVAVAVLLSLWAVTASSAVPHDDDCHGDACITVAAHDPSAHRVAAPSTHEAHAHCAVCHWVRALRQSSGVSQALAAPTEHAVRVPVRTFVPLPLFHAAQPSLRSPPAIAPAFVF